MLATIFIIATSILILHGQIKDRILSDNFAQPEQFPFVVSVRGKGQHICGGAILNHQWVLTVANCITETRLKNIEEITVMAGSVDMNGIGGSLHAISSIFIHQDDTLQGNPSKMGDVALLKLVNVFEFSDSLQPIKVGEVSVGTEVTMLGWGATTTGNLKMSSVLKYVHMVTTTSDSDCVDDESHVCAVAAAGEGTCIGDTGGPLIDSYYKHLVAIDSAGSKFCGSGVADTFTRVAPYISWINFITSMK